MNTKITIPENWNPHDTESFNKWIDKINTLTIKSKY